MPFRRLFSRFVQPARLGIYLQALWRLFRDPATPAAAKWVAIFVVAYAASPIDLIPDFIPVIGQLDDLLLIPLGIALVLRLTPKPLWEAHLREAERRTAERPRLLWGAAIVVAVWTLCAAGLGWIVWRWAGDGV